MSRPTTEPIFTLEEVNSVWRDVLPLGQRQVVPKGYQWHISQGSASFSFLESGRIRLSGSTYSCRERIVLLIGKGCLFREVGFLYMRLLAPITLRAEEECEIYNFSTDILRDMDFIRQHPEQISNLVLSLGKKAGAFFQQLASSAEQNPEEILYRFLLDFIQKSDSNIVPLKMSQEEVACMLGIHRSTLCRLISQLRQEGIIGKFTKQGFEVLNRSELERRCKGW